MLLGSERAGEIKQQLAYLKENGISFHAQCVLCPGVNDGEVLTETIEFLMDMYPACLSLALVPVGLTCHRKNLTAIKPYTKEQAKAVIDIANKYRKICLRETDSRFVFPSDEFYLLAGEEIPSDSEYEDYAQIDNGVGLVRSLIEEFEYAYNELAPKYKKTGRELRSVTIATGVSAQPVLKKLMDEHPITSLNVKVVSVKNRFFGESVTVAGLITGNDLVSQLKTSKTDAILITECMLRNEGDRFLDDMKLEDAVRMLGKPVVPVGRTGEDLLNALLRQARI